MQTPPRQPNILLILADQFRADCLGAAGNPVIKTPNLDGLAAGGTLFSQCFCQAAPCGPSRMSLYTGRYMCSTRSIDNMTPLVDADENLAMYLKRAGYGTGILGYNDYAVDPRILPDGDSRKTSLNYDNFLPGFDYVYDHEYYSPEYFAYLRERGYPEEWCGPRICSEHDVPPGGPEEHLPLRFPARYAEEDSEAQFLAGKAVAQISAQRNCPWFLSVNFIKPHPPLICPAPFNDMYDPADMPAPNATEKELTSSHPYFDTVDRQAATLSGQHLRELQACYYGMISEVDTCVGKILDAVKASGQWDNTVIVFTSDHGEYLGDHHFTGKGHFYDGTMRIPLIVRDPSSAAMGVRDDGLVELIDLAPTILDLVGVPCPAFVQGCSILDRCQAPGEHTGKDGIHFEFSFRNRFKADAATNPDECLLWVLRDERFKYVQFGLDWPPLLFDLITDPDEQTDVAQRPEAAPVLAEYARRMLRWRMKNEDQRMERWAAKYR